MTRLCFCAGLRHPGLTLERLDMSSLESQPSRTLAGIKALLSRPLLNLEHQATVTLHVIDGHDFADISSHFFATPQAHGNR